MGVATVVVSATGCNGTAVTAAPAVARCPAAVGADTGDTCVLADWVDEAVVLWTEAESFLSVDWPEPIGLDGGNNS